MPTKAKHRPNLIKFYQDSNKQVIDQTITTYFKKPKSFTGEDMVEISIHGSEAVIKKIFKMTSSQQTTTRIAYPGEFTRRAFENNKLGFNTG